jgi:DNA-directed RNA polymerase specialized sigma24 family protein
MANKRKTDRLDNAQRKTVARRYRSGEALASIADEFGISVSTVREIARAAGAEIRRVGRPMQTS